MTKKDNEQLGQILAEFPQIPAICLDVANGYSEHFVDFVKEVRTRHPDHILMVSTFFFRAPGFNHYINPWHSLVYFCVFIINAFESGVDGQGNKHPGWKFRGNQLVC